MPSKILYAIKLTIAMFPGMYKAVEVGFDATGSMWGGALFSAVVGLAFLWFLKDTVDMTAVRVATSIKKDLAVRGVDAPITYGDVEIK